jgi:hypothetical protein
LGPSAVHHVSWLVWEGRRAAVSCPSPFEPSKAVLHVWKPGGTRDNTGPREHCL